MFFLSIELLKNKQVKVTYDQSANVDSIHLCEILLTASITLQKTHPHLLKALLFCMLEVLMEDKELLRKLEDILQSANQLENTNLLK